MLTRSDPVILARAVLAAGLGFLIGWERQVTGSPIEACTIGLAALTAACLTALTWWPPGENGRSWRCCGGPARRTADVPQPTPTKVSR